MLSTILTVLGILFIHWIADFILQTDKMAKGKSKNMEDLLDHTYTYSGVFVIASLIYSIVTGNWAMAIIFPPITLLCHTVTDYITSRVNAKLWAKGDVHNFFVSVGFDQFLHAVQLLLTFYYLS